MPTQGSQIDEEVRHGDKNLANRTQKKNIARRNVGR